MFAAHGADERPALDELRALRRAVRDRALLRRHLDEAPGAAAAPALLAFGVVVFLATVVWIATFPVSVHL